MSHNESGVSAEAAKADADILKQNKDIKAILYVFVYNPASSNQSPSPELQKLLIDAGIRNMVVSR